MKKMVAVLVVVAVTALSSSALMAAPTKGATMASENAGLYSKVLNFLTTMIGDSSPRKNPVRGESGDKGPGSTVKSPGDSTDEGVIWYCRRCPRY